MATNTSTNSSPESNLQTGGSDPMALMNAVIQKQLSTSGMVSSATPTLEASILSAQKGVREAVVGENAALQSKFEREMGYGLEAGQEAMTAGRAAGSGGILNMAALRSLTETTDKSLKDLQQRKEELIMQNNSAAAAKIADLEYKAIEFRERANQQVFSNLLNLGQFGIQRQQEERAQSVAKDVHTKALVEMIQENPQAGIMMNDTLEQAAGKIGLKPNSPKIQLIKAQTLQAIAAANKKDLPGTESERKSAALSAYEKRFVYGAKLPDKTKIIDDNGYITPKAFKAAIKDAPSEGISRKDFIEQFGYLLSPFEEGSKKTGTGYAKYGLTAQEIKLVTGSLD